MSGNLVNGANMAGFLKVANAMLGQGLFQASIRADESGLAAERWGCSTSLAFMAS
jgi:hypothetical protein